MTYVYVNRRLILKIKGRAGAEDIERILGIDTFAYGYSP